VTFQNPIQNGSNLIFFASGTEESNFRSTFASESGRVVIFHQNKENPNPKDAILA